MPNARARLEPTTSITTAPTTARMICVWMTGACRCGVPRRRGRSASTQARPAAIGSRVTRVPEVDRTCVVSIGRVRRHVARCGSVLLLGAPAGAARGDWTVEPSTSATGRAPDRSDGSTCTIAAVAIEHAATALSEQVTSAESSSGLSSKCLPEFRAGAQLAILLIWWPPRAFRFRPIVCSSTARFTFRDARQRSSTT